MRRPPLVPGGRRVDLHTHSFFSDGVLSPEDLVARARLKGLAGLALTDHDSIEGVERAAAAAIVAGIDLVPGVELSSSLDGLDLHILGYYVNPDHPGLRERLEEFKQERRDRIVAIVGRLEALGAVIALERVLALAGPGVVGRPHVAQALLEAGLVEHQEDAFRRFLGAHGPAFVPRPAFSPTEAIALIHAADGVSVLAHPGPQLAESIVEGLATAGLRGVEVWHPHHTSGTSRRYQALADRLGLLETGGSDFHGEHRSLDLGDVGVPILLLERLKEAAGVSG
ncbi:MAG TPA: PHP domain-containing protein [Candidatus Limnocylindria bacterium]|nr:PHP domain-containing protein [Candidatus Limnocylindria bacterium]